MMAKHFTEAELEYMCRFHDKDGILSVAYALGRSQRSIDVKIQNLKKSGEYEKYRNSRVHWA